MDEGEDDQAIERKLALTEVQELDNESLWTVVMTTATPEVTDDDDRRLETDGQLVLAVYGDKCGSADYLLEPAAGVDAKKLYQAGQTDEFKVRATTGLKRTTVSFRAATVNATFRSPVTIDLINKR